MCQQRVAGAGRGAAQGRCNQLCISLGLTVLYVIGDNVGNNLDTVLVQFGGSCLEISFGTERIADLHIGGLIEGPPVGRKGTVVGGDLCRLDRRYLHGCITGSGDLGSIPHEVGHAPVESVQDITALDVGSKSIVRRCVDRGRCGIDRLRRERAGDHNDSQHHGKYHDHAYYFFHLHIKTS